MSCVTYLALLCPIMRDYWCTVNVNALAASCQYCQKICGIDTYSYRNITGCMVRLSNLWLFFPANISIRLCIKFVFFSCPEHGSVLYEIRKLHTNMQQILGAFEVIRLSSLGKFSSRRYIEIFFLIFPRKWDSTFHANCLYQFVFCWVSPESGKH